MRGCIRFTRIFVSGGAAEPFQKLNKTGRNRVQGTDMLFLRIRPGYRQTGSDSRKTVATCLGQSFGEYRQASM